VLLRALRTVADLLRHRSPEADLSRMWVASDLPRLPRASDLPRLRLTSDLPRQRLAPVLRLLEFVSVLVADLLVADLLVADLLVADLLVADLLQHPSPEADLAQLRVASALLRLRLGLLPPLLPRPWPLRLRHPLRGLDLRTMGACSRAAKPANTCWPDRRTAVAQSCICGGGGTGFALEGIACSCPVASGWALGTRG
jgi:hypothetical protein